MLDDNELLFDELYEKTKDCGRVQFINLLMEKERENQELKKQLEEHNLAIENLAYWKGKNESKMKINRLRRENQELKKQLEVGKEQYNYLVEEKEKIQEQLEASEKARKEAIEYIKNNPLYEEEYDYNYDDELELLGINSNQAEYDLLDILNIDKQIDKYAEKINDDPKYDDLEPIEFREHMNHVKEEMMKDIDKGE